MSSMGLNPILITEKNLYQENEQIYYLPLIIIAGMNYEEFAKTQKMNNGGFGRLSKNQMY